MCVGALKIKGRNRLNGELSASQLAESSQSFNPLPFAGLWRLSYDDQFGL